MSPRRSGARVIVTYTDLGIERVGTTASPPRHNKTYIHAYMIYIYIPYISRALRFACTTSII